MKEGTRRRAVARGLVLAVRAIVRVVGAILIFSNLAVFAMDLAPWIGRLPGARILRAMGDLLLGPLHALGSTRWGRVDWGPLLVAAVVASVRAWLDAPLGRAAYRLRPRPRRQPDPVAPAPSSSP